MLIRPLPGTDLSAVQADFTPAYPIADAENFPPSNYGDRYERIFPANVPSVVVLEQPAIIIEDGDESWLLDGQ